MHFVNVSCLAAFVIVACLWNGFDKLCAPIFRCVFHSKESQKAIGTLSYCTRSQSVWHYQNQHNTQSLGLQKNAVWIIRFTRDPTPPHPQLYLCRIKGPQTWTYQLVWGHLTLEVRHAGQHMWELLCVDITGCTGPIFYSHRLHLLYTVHKTVENIILMKARSSINRGRI